MSGRICNPLLGNGLRVVDATDCPGYGGVISEGGKDFSSTVKNWRRAFLQRERGTEAERKVHLETGKISEALQCARTGPCKECCFFSFCLRLRTAIFCLLFKVPLPTLSSLQ